MRVRALVFICFVMAGCKDPLDRHGPETRVMENEPSDVRVGRDALKVWAEMSKEERAQAMAAFAAEGGGAGDIPSTLGIVVLDEDLPLSTAAAIIPDPERTNGHLVVLAQGSYSDAVFSMVTQTLAHAETSGLVKRHSQLRVTTSATLTNEKMDPLMELRPPDAELTRTSATLYHLMAIATSAKPIDVPNLGKGTVYRF